MTDQTAQEPTMEEILASIRRIISEDDSSPPAAAAEETTLTPTSDTAPEAEPEVVLSVDREPDPEPEVTLTYEREAAEEPVLIEDDVLELTQKYQPGPAETVGDLDVGPAAVDIAPEPEPAAWTPPPAAPARAPLVSDSTAAVAAASFAGLSSAAALPAVGGKTVEEIARELLQPMLKGWLEENLPRIVEAEVRKEVERISRSAG